MLGNCRFAALNRPVLYIIHSGTRPAQVLREVAALESGCQRCGFLRQVSLLASSVWIGGSPLVQMSSRLNFCPSGHRLLLHTLTLTGAGRLHAGGR